MATVYTPTAAVMTSMTVPSDGDARSAAAYNVPLEAVADWVAYLAAIGMKSQIFTASGTFNSPANCQPVGFVYGYGGGGGGGGGNAGNATAANSSCGGAGGGGSIDSLLPIVLAPSTPYTVTVGAGGAGGAIASTDIPGGGTSSFAAQAVFVGGGPGTGTSDAATSTSSATKGGNNLGAGTLADYNVRVPVVNIADLVVPIPGLGGAGLNAILARASLAGNPNKANSSTNGGAFGATSGGTHKGGGGGGGGGAGVGGNGGAGGAGGGGNSAGVGVAGSVGTAAAANTGAGGGGGGAGGQGSGGGGAGAAGGAGGSGKVIVFYFGT